MSDLEVAILHYGLVSFQALPKCSDRSISAGLEIPIYVCFSSFSRMGKVLRKVRKNRTNMTIITLAWQTQSWYPILFEVTIKNLIFLPNYATVLLSPEGKINPLIQNSLLRLVARLVLGTMYPQKECQKWLSTL